MNIRKFAATVIACSALTLAAQAQSSGSMSGPGGSMPSHTSQTSHGCTNAANHMSGGSMANGNHMSGGTMSGGSMSGGDHMSGGAMSGGDHMAGGGMSSTNHMAGNGDACQPSSTPKSN
jgi:hypothetical protein